MADNEMTPPVGEELVKRDIISQEQLDRAHERELTSGIPWYRQLLQLRMINFGVLEDVLRHEFHSKSLHEEHLSLGRMLVELKAISEEQLEDALTEQKRNGRLLGGILLDRGLITHHTIGLALSKQFDMEYADIHDTPSEQDALDAIPESMARKNLMVPIHIEGDKLTVLITNPRTREYLKNVGVLLGKRIYPILTSADDIRTEITERYAGVRGKVVRSKTQRRRKGQTYAIGSREVSEASTAKPAEKTEVQEVAEETVTSKPEPASEGSRFDSIAKESMHLPVIKLVSTIIEGAVNSNATDVHLDPQEPEMRVRYRIDGVLHDIMSIPRDTEGAVISRVKVLGDLDITETRRPQDGHVGLDINGKSFDIRIASMPTVLGERVVLRLLDQTSVLAGIRDLGLESEDERKLARALDEPYGMILVTGPTGSGKTTTLYAALNQKNVLTDSIVTLEDPVEYQLSGINQVQVDPDIGLTFANTLRASLRQDIDVLLVGEIRDAETAHIAIRAAMTGHLVFSTLHTNNAPEAIDTLRNMGIQPFLISSALTAIVAQRLVRKTCTKCKKPFKPSKTLLKSIGLPESTKYLYRGSGCDACYHTGKRGRTGVFEILEVTPAVRDLITSEQSISKIVKATKFKSMADRCREKVKQGLVTPEEYLRIIRA